jgi:hypothetical protein
LASLREAFLSHFKTKEFNSRQAAKPPRFFNHFSFFTLRLGVFARDIFYRGLRPKKFTRAKTQSRQGLIFFKTIHSTGNPIFHEGFTKIQ